MRLPSLRFAVQMTKIAVVGLGTLVVFSFWMFVLRPREQHSEWYHDIEDHIVMLADKRPDGVSPSQWAYCLSWTWQLHSNCGGYEYFDHSERARFLAEFDRRITETVNLGTIDWIWDEYVEHSRGGRHYSRRYRPSDPDHLRDFLAGKQGDFDLRWCLDRLGRLPTRGARDDPERHRDRKGFR
jgi:hypothetical protein